MRVPLLCVTLLALLAFVRKLQLPPHGYVFTLQRLIFLCLILEFTFFLKALQLRHLETLLTVF